MEIKHTIQRFFFYWYQRLFRSHVLFTSYTPGVHKQMIGTVQKIEGKRYYITHLVIVNNRMSNVKGVEL